jgi:TonB family protein
MISLIFEAALRSLILGVLVWLATKALRVRDPRLERNVWLVTLAAAYALPWLMQVELLTAPTSSDVPWYPYVQAITFDASGAPGWSTIALTAYLGVAGTLLARQLLGLANAWKMRSRARVHREISGVRTSADLRAPATVFSTVIVPDTFGAWTAEQQRAALAHEQTHVANHDFYVQQLAQLHRNLFWLNPFAWWLVRRIAILNEHISDDAALRTMSRRSSYAEFLLGFATCASHDEHSVAMARPTTLIGRIERILDEDGDVSVPNRGRRVAALAGVLSLVAIASGVSTSVANETLQTPKKSLPKTSPEILEAGNGVILPRSNPDRPLSQPVYPPPSRRLLESGTVVLHLHVLPNGRVSDAVVMKSSGFLELDNAARYESFRWQLDPGTVNGTPTPMWGKFAVTFKLNQ